MGGAEEGQTRPVTSRAKSREAALLHCPPHLPPSPSASFLAEATFPFISGLRTDGRGCGGGWAARTGRIMVFQGSGGVEKRRRHFGTCFGLLSALRNFGSSLPASQRRLPSWRALSKGAGAQDCAGKTSSPLRTFIIRDSSRFLFQPPPPPSTCSELETRCGGRAPHTCSWDWSRSPPLQWVLFPPPAPSGGRTGGG